MRNALLMRLPSTRSSKERSITLNSQAYSTNRSLAMEMKFWSMVFLIIPSTKAKVTEVAAMMMHGRLTINVSVRNFLGRRNLMPTKLNVTEMMP